MKTKLIIAAILLFNAATESVAQQIVLVLRLEGRAI